MDEKITFEKGSTQVKKPETPTRKFFHTLFTVSNKN